MITTALAKYYTMRIKEILVEYARAPLYHGTSIKNAENILNEGYLSWLRVGSHSEGQISLSRNFANARMFAYGENEPGVVFVLDQDALKQTLGRKLKPYDWQSGTQGGEDEDEEAVFSQTNVPINSKTIIEIIVMVDANLIKWDKDIELALTKKYPKVFEAPKDVLMFRYLNYSSISHQLDELIKKLQSGKIFINKIFEYGPFIIIKDIEYIPHRELTSWTTNFNTLSNQLKWTSSEMGLISITDKNCFMNPELSQIFDLDFESEIIHFGKIFNNMINLILDKNVELLIKKKYNKSINDILISYSDKLTNLGELFTIK